MPIPKRQRISLVIAGVVAALLTTSACSGPAGNDLPAPPETTSTATDPVSAADPVPSPDPVPPLPPGNASSRFGAALEECPGDADVSNPGPPGPIDRKIEATVSPVDGLRLGDGWYNSTDLWSREQPPRGDIASGIQEPAIVQGGAPGMVFSYQIYNAAGATGFWVCAKFYSPASLFNSNNGSCFVYDGDPRNAAPPVRLSSYTCVWTDVRGENPEPVLTVGVGTVVTSKDQAKNLLTRYCNQDDAASRCAFVNFGYGTALGAFRALGQTVVNNGETEVEHELGGETEEVSINSVGVELEITVGFWKTWEAALKTKYDHTWETRHKFVEKTTAKIDANSVGWVEFAPNMQGTIGTWIVETGDHRYVIPDVALAAPLADGGQLVVYECAIAHYRDGVCKEGLKTSVLVAGG